MDGIVHRQDLAGIREESTTMARACLAFFFLDLDLFYLFILSDLDFLHLLLHTLVSRQPCDGAAPGRLSFSVRSYSCTQIRSVLIFLHPEQTIFFCISSSSDLLLRLSETLATNIVYRQSSMEEQVSPLMDL
jgi:hypothetical protein